MTKPIWPVLAYVTAITAAILGAAGAVAVVSDFPYRPVLMSEHLELASRSYAHELQVHQSEMYAVQREINAYQSKGRPVPNYLLNRLNWLRGEIAKLKRRLKM